MADYKWPEANKRSLIGKRISRVDGPPKVTGKAKYTYDIKRPGMLYGKILHSPYAHAKIVSIDTSAAEKMPGVKAVKIIQGPGTEIQWAGNEIVVVAAVDEPTAEDAIRAIKVQYEVLPHIVNEDDLSKIPQDRRRPGNETLVGDPDKAFKESEVVVEGVYGNTAITHCCLEAHGQIVEWEDGSNVLIHPSTQSVSSVGGELARNIGIPAGNVRLKMEYIGGGFGSKFNIDRWGVECALISKQAEGKPVKLMLDRGAELMIAGMRPSGYARVKVGAKKDGTLTAWESESWGTAGYQPYNLAGQTPYIFGRQLANRRVRHISVFTNTGPQKAWRAPIHPQTCLITMSALDDLAAALKMDPLDFFLKNIELTGTQANVYRDELLKAAEMIEWKKNWHPRGEGGSGPVKRGLGLSIHTWGGGPGRSDCNVTVQPDGSVELKLGTQDLGTGTRTIINIVAAETFGLPLEAVKVLIGDNRYPFGQGSGGSTTVGGVSSSTRRASVDALNQLFAKVAPDLGVPSEQLEAVGGKVQVIGNSSKSMTWKQACAKLGTQPITALGKEPAPGSPPLASSGVGGVQMADVSVDIETGIVKMNKIVCVQDCGLVMDLKTAESQVYGAMIMGVAYSLFEERVMDDKTGRMLNANMEFYRLGGIGDIGEMQVHFMTGPGYDERGPIGLGEPPTVSPGAAISNAVANAIGVRVPNIPITPQRVLAALEKKGGNRA
jgi:xanthine dehydrogenase YagR molybdenum-binding subunit